MERDSSTVSMQTRESPWTYNIMETSTVSDKQVRAVFLDKDGTLIRDIPYNTDPTQIELMPGVVEGLQLLKKHGYRLIVVTNQSGIARGYFTIKELNVVRRRIEELLRPYHLILDDFLFCPHHPDGCVKSFARSCNCRKPMAGLLVQAASRHQIDLSGSWMIGDILHDVEAGNRAGCTTILLDNGNETEWALSPWRYPFAMVPDFYSAAVRIIKYENHALQHIEISKPDKFICQKESTRHRRSST